MENFIKTLEGLPHPVFKNKLDEKYLHRLKPGTYDINSSFIKNDERKYFFVYRNHMEKKLPVFTISQELQRTIEKTDSNEDIPCDYIKSPVMEGCYFHLPYSVVTNRNRCRLEGFYVQLEHNDISTEIAGNLFISIYPVFDNEIMGKFVIPNTKDSLGNYFKIMCDYEKYWEEEKTLFNHVVVLLFYCNSSQYRTELRPEYTELLEKAKLKKSPGKRKSILNKAKRKYDYILISPVTSSNQSIGSGKNVCAHFRRGHFRLQHYGPRWTMEKLIFIEPCFIHEKTEMKDYIMD